MRRQVKGENVDVRSNTAQGEPILNDIEPLLYMSSQHYFCRSALRSLCDLNKHRPSSKYVAAQEA